MAKAKGLHAPSSVQLTYQLLRNTTSPDEVISDVKSYVVNLPVFEILKLGTKENLRNYLAEYNPKRRNRVHDAIKYTIQSAPQRFITRNSGFVIGASNIIVDDQKRSLVLYDASILNGAQSQGEIRAWALEEFGDDLPDSHEDPPFFVRAEIIVDSDSDEVVETAIARNTATPVKNITQAGARGHLNDLQKSIQKVFPKLRIRMSETDEDVVDTRKILQYTRLLMPLNVSKNGTAAEKLRAYKNPEQCLTEFSEWYDTQREDPAAKLKYDFMVQMAPHAISEYNYWETHDSWNSHHIWEETKKGGRACRRDEATKRIKWLSPALLFPILGAMSEFVKMSPKGHWIIDKPRIFKPTEMIKRAVDQFRGKDSDPMRMGRDAGVYDALRIYPATLVEVLNDKQME